MTLATKNTDFLPNTKTSLSASLWTNSKRDKSKLSVHCQFTVIYRNLKFVSKLKNDCSRPTTLLTIWHLEFFPSSCQPVYLQRFDFFTVNLLRTLEQSLFWEVEVTNLSTVASFA